MKTSVIIPAAGTGKRFGGQIPKQFTQLFDKPILIYTLLAFEIHPLISSIILSVSEDWIDSVVTMIQPYNISKIKTITIGGAERQFSIENALSTQEALSSDIILVHDAVRPFVSQSLISTIISTAMTSGAVIPALLPKETIKSINPINNIIQTLDRSLLRSAQTPQGFQRHILVNAYENARKHSLSATDDASLVEEMGSPVAIVDGEETNIKVTTPLDLKLAELIFQENLLS